MANLTRSSKNYLYTTWRAMLRRCADQNLPTWESYGGRGITVCDRWMCFELFVEDMSERPSRKHTLERIDNDGGYSPSNCRWATMAEQAQNRRMPRPRHSAIRVDGLTLSQLAKLHGIKHTTIKRRYQTGRRGAELLAKDLRDGSVWRGKKRRQDGSMMNGQVVQRS